MKTFFKATLMAVLLVGFLTTISAFTLAWITPAATEPKSSPAKMGFIYDKGELAILNYEHFHLLNCTVGLHIGGHPSTYVDKHVDLPANDIAILDSLDFANGASEVFNATQYRPDMIYVECDSSQGKKEATVYLD